MPITATRLPRRSTSWSQRAEWKSAPPKSSMPSMSGSRGSESPPAATTSVRAVTRPAEVSTTQRWAAWSQAADSIVVEKRKRSRVPERSAVRRR